MIGLEIKNKNLCKNNFFKPANNNIKKAKEKKKVSKKRKRETTPKQKQIKNNNFFNLQNKNVLQGTGSDGKPPGSACGITSSGIKTNFELTDEQKLIINNKDENIIVQGVPGSAKTETLVLRLCNKLKNKNGKKYNIIMLAKVSNIGHELIERIRKYIPNIVIKNSGKSSRYTFEYEGHHIEISNFDSFIDSQLRFYYKKNKPKCIEYMNIKGFKKTYTFKNGFDLGRDFNTKKEIFYHLVKENKLEFKLKNKKLINKIIFDEVQDFLQTIAITVLSILKYNSKISFEGYGDILQSIWYVFEKNNYTKGFTSVSINILKNKIKNIKEYPLTMCFRCPLYHCELLKIINEEANKKYNRKEIQTKSLDIKHRPMYFIHGGINNNIEAENTAKQIFSIIKTILDKDKNIKPGDIVILSKKVNKNLVFEKLEIILKKNELPNVFFQTSDGEGTSKRIDLNKVKEDKCSNCGKKFNKNANKCKKCTTIRKNDKITLISGHGFKGGERKCVIVFGFSELSIPRENHPNTPNELSDKSIANVLISRSTKYLFIGSNFSPSRYIANKIYDLSFLYFVEDFKLYLDNKIKKNEKTSILCKLLKLYKNKDIDGLKKLNVEKNKYETFLKETLIIDLNMPPIYREISDKLIGIKEEINNKEENKNDNKEKTIYKSSIGCLLNNRELEETKHTPDKNHPTITDIAKDVVKYINTECKLDEVIIIKEYNIGNSISINYKNISAAPFIGHIPNIILSIKKSDKFYNYLKNIINNNNNNNNVIFVDEGKYKKIINLLKDNFNHNKIMEGININEFNEEIENNINYKDEKNKLRKVYKNINDFIIPKLYNYNKNTKKLLLPNYFKDIFKNTNLDSNDEIFNICILYDFVYNPFYSSSCYMINNSSEYFIGDLKKCINNKEFENLSNIKLEIPCKEINYIETDQEILKNELLLEGKKIQKNDVSNIKSNCIKKRIDNYHCSISGRIDGYKNDTLYEFKMSNNDEFKKEWKLQILLYAIMGIEVLKKKGDYEKKTPKPIIFDNAILYNFVKGKKYMITFNKDLITKEFIKEMFDEILENFNYKPKLKSNFLNEIINNINYV